MSQRAHHNFIILTFISFILLHLTQTSQCSESDAAEQLSGCWWTGCQKNNWAVTGCGQYDMREISNRNCDEGKEFHCCPPTFITSEKPTDCWWTGCQPKDWAVVGCDQYNKTQKQIRACPNGSEYFCCEKEDNVEEKEKDMLGETCWWSTCQLKVWKTRGCPENMTQKGTEPCDDGHLFECCSRAKTNQRDEQQVEELTGESFENFVKYMLLKSRNFSVQPSNLKCQSLDPDKAFLIKIGNEGIRVCDICPNFPQIHFEDMFLDTIPMNTTSNVNFQDCFGQCSSQSECMAMSYDTVSHICYLFNNTIGLLKSDTNWKTIFMTQPSGILENWVYVRHTGITGIIYKSHSKPSFLTCLEECEKDRICNHISYNLKSNDCFMFDKSESIESIDLRFAWLSAFNITDIPQSSKVAWRFIQEGGRVGTGSENDKITDTQCSYLRNGIYGGYFSRECLQSSHNGCDTKTGCRKCYYPEKTETSENLPFCPDSEFKKRMAVEIEVERRMKTCLKNSNCLGVGYREKEAFPEEILLSTALHNYSSQFILRYPKVQLGVQKYLIKYDIILNYDFAKIDGSTEIYKEVVRENSDQCFDEMDKDDRISRASYSSSTKLCKLSSNEVRSLNKPASGIIAIVRRPQLTSEVINYVRLFGFTADLEKANATNLSCISDCENTCARQCSADFKDWCAYFTTNYGRGPTKCFFYGSESQAQIKLCDNSVIYTKVSAMKFDLDSLQLLSEFQPSDIFGCFEGELESTASSTNPETGISLRSKRGFFSSVGNFFKKVGKAIVNTVKDTVETVVDTAKGAVNSVKKLVQGDLKGAKKAFLDIPIVKDVKTAVELGGAVITGDWNKAKEKGISLLKSKTLDLATSVLIPGAGKLIGKGLKTLGNVAENAGKKVKKGIKDSVDKFPPKNKKTKDRKKKDDSKDKDEGKEGQKDHCKARRPKRGTGPSKKRKRPGDDCDDDDDDTTCPFPNDRNIIDSTIKNCRGKKAKSTCEFECEPGYQENQPKVTCSKVGDKLLWQPAPKCSVVQCDRSPYSIITLETPKISLGAIGTSKFIVAYTVLFQRSRKLPVWSIALHQSNDFQSKSYNEFKFKSRENQFKQFPCQELNGHQGDDNDYKGTGWHKGHLTPANIALWSPKATLSSNLYINAAPQDGSTNSGPWKKLEAHVQCFGKRKRLLVATGICPNSIGKTKTVGGLDIPSCFWKMLCYKDEQSNEQVVGFYSENSHATDFDARKRQVFSPISQAEIKRLLSSLPFGYKSPWLTTAMKLNQGREIAISADQSVWLPVNPTACERADSLSDDERDAWAASFAKAEHFLDRGKNPQPKKTKREAAKLDRGCHPSELGSMISLLGLATSVDNDSGIDKGDGKALVTVGKCNKRIIGYYTSWGDKEINGNVLKRVTHVIYAFLEVSSDGRVSVGSPDRKNSENVGKEVDKSLQRLKDLMEMAAAYPHIKVMFAVGGWENSQYFSAIAASSNLRVNFISSVVRMIEKYGFDGVDIDWEYPVTGGAVEGVSSDKANYVTLMKELREVLDNLAETAGRNEKFLLSFAGAAGQWTLDPGFDLPGLLKYADFVNVMTYDFFGAWSSKWGAYTGPPSPLFFGMPPRFSGKTNVAWTIKYYNCKAKLPHKVNMGLPFYGRFWKNVGDPVDGKDGMWRTASPVNGKFEGGYVPWNKIMSDYLSDSKYSYNFHQKAKAPYAWNAAEKIFLGFENKESLGHKVKYAVDKNLGGLMIWAVDLDDEDLTLLETVYNAPLCDNTNPNQLNDICSPIDEKRWWTSEDGDDKAGLCGKSAPLFKGYYPVCDPDDPGYSCCGAFGYCGSGPKFCECPSCRDYGKDPRKILEEPIKPTVPVTWYLLNDADGKRGRCGRKIPKIGSDYPTCNPDDDTSHCCSNAGYCGSLKDHCVCSGCVDFRKNPTYRFGPKKWWTLEDGEDLGGQCGPKAPKVEGVYEAECNPDDLKFFCCGPNGWCGSGPDFCDCPKCKNFKKG